MSKIAVGDLVMFDTMSYQIGIITKITEEAYMPYTIHWFELLEEQYGTTFAHYSSKAVRKYKMNFSRMCNGKI